MSEHQHQDTPASLAQKLKGAIGRLTTSEWLMVFFTAVIAGVGIAGYFVSRGQQTVMQGQLDEMKSSSRQTDNTILQLKRQADIAESGLRPYVLPQITTKDIQVGGGDYGETQLFVYMRFINYGATPAIVTHFEGEITIKLPHDSNFDREDHTTGDLVLFSDKEGASSGNVPPKRYKRTLLGREILAYEAGQTAPYVHGKIDYTDIAGNPFQRQFCYHRVRNVDRTWYLQPVMNQPNCPHGEK